MGKDEKNNDAKPLSLYDRVPAATNLDDPKYDPFRRNDRPLSHPLEILKTIVAVCLFPIKMAFSIWWLCVYLTFIKLGTIGDDVNAAPNRWTRFWASHILDIVCWTGFKLTDWFTFSLGYPFMATYGDNSLTCKKTGEKANIIVSNHSSYLDIFLLMTASEDVPGFVAKAEIEKVGILSWIAHFWRCIYVYRSGEGTKSVTQQIHERALDTDYPPIVVFPEGTTTNNKYLLPFKTGAFVGGHCVKPVIIRYPSKYFSPAWESCKAPQHMLRMFMQVYNRCEIYWLPVYVPNEEEKANPSLYAKNVRDALLQVTDLLESPSSLEDKIAYLKGIRGEFDAS